MLSLPELLEQVQTAQHKLIFELTLKRKAPGKTAYKTPTKRDKDDATTAREDGRKRVKEDEAGSKGEDKGKETSPKMRRGLNKFFTAILAL